MFVCSWQLLSTVSDAQRPSADPSDALTTWVETRSRDEVKVACGWWTGLQRGGSSRQFQVNHNAVPFALDTWVTRKDTAGHVSDESRRSPTDRWELYVTAT